MGKGGETSISQMTPTGSVYYVGTSPPPQSSRLLGATNQLTRRHMAIITEQDIREAYSSGQLTWGDLLEITGLHSSALFEMLYDLMNSKQPKE